MELVVTLGVEIVSPGFSIANSAGDVPLLRKEEVRASPGRPLNRAAHGSTISHGRGLRRGSETFFGERIARSRATSQVCSTGSHGSLGDPLLSESDRLRRNLQY